MLSLPSTSEFFDSEIIYCQVCSQPAHGYHLGAITCRACAAFYRRSVHGNHLTFKCRSGNGKCPTRSNGTFTCKKCRLDRCFAVGMKPEKLQHNRDLISSTEKQKIKSPIIPPSLQGFVGRPLFILSCEPDLATSERTFVDVKYLIDYVSNFLDNPTSNHTECFSSMTMLDKLSFGLNTLRLPTTGEIKVCRKLGKAESLLFWENDVMTVAKWLAYCDEFLQLPRNIKIRFLKSCWHMWMRLERLANIAEAVKNNRNICTMTSSGISVDIVNSESDITWFTKYKKEQLRYFLDPLECLLIPCILDPLNQLEPSIQEITYMLCLLSFRHSGKQFGGDLQKWADRLIENLANDLHNYYLKVLQIENYAGRMAKMMKIVQLIEKDMYERMERTEIARMFNIFILDFSDPEMFYGYKR